MDILDEIIEALEGDSEDSIPIMKSKGIYIEHDPIEDLRFLSLKSYVSRSGICVSHVWNWGSEGTEIIIMMHIISGHDEEYQRLLNEELWEME